MPAAAVAAAAIVLASRDDKAAPITVDAPADGAVIADATPRFTGRAEGAEAVVVSILAGRKHVTTARARVGADGSFATRLGGRLPAGSYTALVREVSHSGEVVGEERREFVRWELGSDAVAAGQFGGGARLCIGASFAMMEAVLLLAAIAQKFRFELVPGHPIIPVPSITLRPKYGMKMTLCQM